MILGGPASGKSTLARQLGAALELPVYHMDQIHWQPGWTERPMEQRAELARAIEVTEAWVFEGSLGATNAHRLSRATSVIYLDLPLPLRLWRALLRSIRYRGQTRPDLPDGCPERLGIETLRFLNYIARTHRPNRRRMAALLAERPEVPLYHLKTPAEVRAFLTALEGAKAV